MSPQQSSLALLLGRLDAARCPEPDNMGVGPTRIDCRLEHTRVAKVSDVQMCLQPPLGHSQHLVKGLAGKWLGFSSPGLPVT